MPLKDEKLNELAKRGFNVARFFSVAPDLTMRFRWTGGSPSGSIDAHLEALLGKSPSINLRCFTRERPQGNPFEYGLTSRRRALEAIREYASQGYYVIVNETIDISDGGVSGVSEGGWLEFAPDATPRVVEESGAVCRLPLALARVVLAAVYGVDVSSVSRQGKRIEFSIHPSPVGWRGERVVVWEESDSPWGHFDAKIDWPNGFSELVGDKAFGLVVASSVGLSVPATLVISRRVPPFSIGMPTGSGESWLRTAPRRPVPGHFTTTRRWTDPFKLLADEDPTGALLASVLVQDGVAAEFSGATLYEGDKTLVEGVAGSGDAFMLGDEEPGDLPDRILKDVLDVVARATTALGPVRIEWAHDGERCWVLQLHLTNEKASGERFVAGEPANGWIQFDPQDGLGRLSELISLAITSGCGIEVTRRVGLSSHVGDLLRRSRVPSLVRRSG